MAVNVKTQNSIMDVFNNWLRKTRSDHTAIAYDRAVRQFFITVFDKEIEEVTIDDLAEITQLMIDRKYKEVLYKRGMKNSTIAYYIGNVAAFFKQLDINRKNDGVNYDYIANIALDARELQVDGGKTPKMSKNDLEAFKSWLVNERFIEGKNAHLGAKYAMVADMLWVTGSRVTAIFNIRWIDFMYEEDSRGKFGYNLYVQDKGKKENRKPITSTFYGLVKERFYQGKDGDKVFGELSRQGFGKRLSEFGELVGKKFSPHSIKVGSVSEVYYITKDIELTARFADHESLETTRGYIDVDNDRTNHGSYILSSNKIGLGDINQLSKEQLLGIIQGRHDFVQSIYHEAASRGYITEGVDNDVVNN